jgi:hypothetical protein
MQTVQFIGVEGSLDRDADSTTAQTGAMLHLPDIFYGVNLRDGVAPVVINAETHA